MITIKKILCPVDFFPASDAAVMYAGSLAKNYDAVIHLLHVITPVATSTYEYAIDTTEIMKAMEQTATREVTNLKAKLKEAGVSAEFEVRVGDVYEEIKYAIEALKPELVVMGTMNIHGKGMLDRALLGSTAERVVRVASCPVMLIPPMKRKIKRRARPAGRSAA